MENYHYKPLSSDCVSIRLLRLLPNAKPFSEIRCELFEYTVQPSPRPHLYEALSYVWRDPENRLSIVVNDCRLYVTRNLHAALRNLRNHSLDRVLWIDAVCINQEDDREKEKQIQYMGRIYAQANRVIVWLGESSIASHIALEGIRAVAEDVERSLTYGQQNDIVALLSRPWFRRIWVLQEVVAARQITIISGFDKIDGYTFCRGLDKLALPNDKPDYFQTYLGSATYLMRGAIFRSRNRATSSSQVTLGELVDRYHTYEATKWHDKIYALLGMSSDNPSPARLAPNYTISWPALLQELVRFLLCDQVTVHASEDRQLAVIKGQGYILGRVISTRLDDKRPDLQYVEVVFRDSGIGQAQKKFKKPFVKWTITSLTRSIQPSDIVCYIQGAKNPIFVRMRENFFEVVMMSPNIQDDLKDILPPQDHGCKESGEYYPRELLFIWDWTTTHEGRSTQERIDLSETIYALYSEYSNSITSEPDRYFEMGVIADQLDDERKAIANFSLAKAGYTRVLGNDHPQVIEVLRKLQYLYGFYTDRCNVEDCLIEIIQVQRRLYGKDHQDTLESKVSLALEQYRGGEIRKGEWIDCVLHSVRQNRRPEFPILEEHMIEAAGRKSRGLLMLLLDMERETIPMTERVCEAAVGNVHCAGKAVALLLDERGDDIQITQRLVEVALGNSKVP